MAVFIGVGVESQHLLLIAGHLLEQTHEEEEGGLVRVSHAAVLQLLQLCQTLSQVSAADVIQCAVRWTRA